MKIQILMAVLCFVILILFSASSENSYVMRILLLISHPPSKPETEPTRIRRFNQWCKKPVVLKTVIGLGILQSTFFVIELLHRMVQMDQLYGYFASSEFWFVISFGVIAIILNVLTARLSYNLGNRKENAKRKT